MDLQPLLASITLVAGGINGGGGSEVMRELVYTVNLKYVKNRHVLVGYSDTNSITG